MPPPGRRRVYEGFSAGSAEEAPPAPAKSLGIDGRLARAGENVDARVLPRLVEVLEQSPGLVRGDDLDDVVALEVVNVERVLVLRGNDRHRDDHEPPGAPRPL